MKIKIWTLPFSAALGGFDDTALRAFLRDKELVCFWEHLFTNEGQPHLVCIVEWEESLSDRRASENGTRRRPPRDRSDPTEGLDPADKLLFGNLRAWRASKAREEGVPAYRILTNRELREIVQRKPRDAQALAEIPGLGPVRATAYGPEILSRSSSSGPGAILDTLAKP